MSLLDEMKKAGAQPQSDTYQPVLGPPEGAADDNPFALEPEGAPAPSRTPEPAPEPAPEAAAAPSRAPEASPAPEPAAPPDTRPPEKKAPRKRGRPKGSKNKSKKKTPAEPPESQEAPAPPDDTENWKRVDHGAVGGFLAAAAATSLSRRPRSDHGPARLLYELALWAPTVPGGFEAADRAWDWYRSKMREVENE